MKIYLQDKTGQCIGIIADQLVDEINVEGLGVLVLEDGTTYSFSHLVHGEQAFAFCEVSSYGLNSSQIQPV